MKNINDYKESRKIFMAEADFSDGSASNIWREFRRDFQNQEKSDLRGYGLSCFSDRRRNIYINGRKIVRLPFRVVQYLSRKLERSFLSVLSWLVLSFDSKAGHKFGFDDYSESIYEKELVQLFSEKYKSYGIGLSHNTLKSFSYLEKLKSVKQLKSSLNVFEIGGGVFNFGHLLSLELESFEYVICDLPEMILTAHKEITEVYLPNCGGDYQVFLPHEISSFDSSDYSRKILLITPEQLHSGVLGETPRFDLFVNHESFAEMNIETVNAYLKILPKLLKLGSIVNVVNRHSRPQALTADDFRNITLEDGITSFSNYDLSFCTPITQEFDEFRSRIPGQQLLPNVFFVGEVTK